MTGLSFAIESVRVERYAAAPTLLFRLAIDADATERIDSIMLRCQVQIAPRQRNYSRDEHERLFELFGEPERWAETLKPLLWTHAMLIVPEFQGATKVDLPIACTYDLEVTAAKYFQSLEDGDVPLDFLFSGTVFVRAENGIRIAQIPWSKEAHFRMPVRVWRELMDQYFPGCSWIRLRRESIDALQRFKTARGLLSLDDAVDVLMESAAPKVGQ